MTSFSSLEADRDQIQRFVASMFQYAGEAGFVSLRGFRENQEQVFEIASYEMGRGRDGLINAATAMATRAARSERPVVFAPPVAIVNNSRSAGESDLPNGLALSVECDQKPSAARAQLEYRLGPATMVVASGARLTLGAHA